MWEYKMRFPKFSTLEKWEKDYIKYLISTGRDLRIVANNEESGFHRGAYYATKENLLVFLFALTYKEFKNG